jgi:hypothetical protein
MRIHVHLFPEPEYFTVHVSAQDSQHNADCDPDMLTDEGTSTEEYTICCVLMQLTSILKTRVPYWISLHVMASIEGQARNVQDHYYLQLVDTVKYILKGILVCIIQEDCSDQEESIWKR